MSRPLRLRRVAAGRYADDRNDVQVEFDGDVWLLIVRGSWVTTEHTKRACVDEWVRQQERAR